MIIRTLIVSFAVCLVFAIGLRATIAVQKPDFSGTWVLDKSKSDGLPPGMEQTLKIVQTGDKIDAETKIVSPQGEQTLNSSYILDGKEREVVLPGPMPGVTAKGKQTANWSADGTALGSEDVGTFDTPYGAVTIKTKRKWRLSVDGQTLTIELSREGPMSMQSKRVFVRKAS
jgi:hypothetical protein